MKKLLFFVTEDWFFCSHFLERAVAAQKAGFEVSVLTRVKKHGSTIVEHGLKLFPLNMVRRSLNPLNELSAFRHIVRIYREYRPDVVHHVALKPIVYGTLAAGIAGICNIVNAPVGLGYVFVSERLSARISRPLVRQLYRWLMNPPGSVVVVENPDDLALLSASGIVRPKQGVLIKGAGVDLERFAWSPLPVAKPIVMLASRMLWDKGVAEFVRAAKVLRDEGIDCRFVLVGDSDPGNPSSIAAAQLDAWHREGTVEWWGRRENMPDVLSQAYLVCLPSYREGLPKVLIEAAAIGRPLIATDVPGCREVVQQGENGLLVSPKDSASLVQAVREILRSRVRAEAMGRYSRHIAEAQFGLERVIDCTLALYERLLGEAANREGESGNR